MKRALLVPMVLAALATSMTPAAARHTDRHCTLTLHHPLGTDDLPLPEDVPVGGIDIGFIKVFVNCQHGHGSGR